MLNKTIIFIILFLMNPAANADDTGIGKKGFLGPSDAKYVAINVEVKELGEAGKVLNEATEKLSQTLNSISNNLEDLSPEQLAQINELADKVKEISLSLSTTVNELPKAIERAQTPSAEIVENALAQVKTETIDPVVSKLELWLIITIVGLVILGIGLFIAFAYCAKQLGKIGGSIKEIANGYRIIPVEQYQAKEEKSISKDSI